MAKMSLMGHLKSQGFNDSDVEKVINYREKFPVGTHERLVQPETLFVGAKVLKTCVQALLAGQHLILEGGKGVGKNTLIDTLACMFKRPTYEYPFNGGTDVANIIGEDTLSVDENGNSVVTFKKHQLLNAMQDEVGAWFVADEVNMTRAEVLSVLHMVADYRGKIDVPGYGVVRSHPAFRIIATMNYGYMGTAELNEAFADRFTIVHVPSMSEKDMARSLLSKNPMLNPDIAARLAKLFDDLDRKAKAGAITSRAVTVRGLYQTISLVAEGCDPKVALECCVTNKAFDSYERTQINDTINTLFKESDVWTVDYSKVKTGATVGTRSIKSEAL